jgi:hypothetical protein
VVEEVLEFDFQRVGTTRRARRLELHRRGGVERILRSDGERLDWPGALPPRLDGPHLVVVFLRDRMGGEQEGPVVRLRDFRPPRCAQEGEDQEPHLALSQVAVPRCRIADAEVREAGLRTMSARCVHAGR